MPEHEINTQEVAAPTDSDALSREMERDARRYNKAFTEEEEARLS